MTAIVFDEDGTLEESIASRTVARCIAAKVSLDLQSVKILLFLPLKIQLNIPNLSNLSGLIRLLQTKTLAGVNFLLW